MNKVRFAWFGFLIAAFVLVSVGCSPSTPPPVPTDTPAPPTSTATATLTPTATPRPTATPNLAATQQMEGRLAELQCSESLEIRSPRYFPSEIQPAGLGIRAIITSYGKGIGMRIEVRLLGGFTVLSDGIAVDALRAPRIQALMGYLALHLNTALPRSQIAYLFWPDSAESQAYTNLRKSIHLMRQAFPQANAVLEMDGNSVTLSGRDVWVDAVEFGAAIQEAARTHRSGNRTAEQAALEKAVDLYTGDLLPGLYEEWVIPEREHLRAQAIQALERLSALLENQQHYRDAAHCAEQLLEYDSLQEEAYQRLMRLYALIGDRAAALHAYHRCATVLSQELDTSPSLETREAYARILQLDSVALSEPVKPQSTARMVGRESEWKQLQLTWRETVRGKAQVALISGEAGIGKTRLADEMLEWAERQGYFAARAVCYAAEGSLPFAPAAAWLAARPLPRLDAHWLSEIARILPGAAGQPLEAASTAPMAEPWHRQHLFEALARGLLEGPQPILCLIDNIHWCDADTLQWLHFLMRFQPRAKLLVLATSRPEDFESAPGGEGFLASLAENEQLVCLNLRRFDDAQTRDLASQLAGRILDAEEATALFRETEGVPLFIVEIVRAALAERGPVHGREGWGNRSLPFKVQAVIAERLSRLSPNARDALEAAAVIGREFSLDLLRFTVQLGEPVLLQVLDDLWKRRIINDDGDAYDFSHDRVRETVYAGIGAERRGLLHRRVAETLESAHSRELDAFSAQIAGHLESAGQMQRAASYYLRAARYAQRMLAIDDALKHIQHALILNRESQMLPDLNEAQGDFLVLQEHNEDAGVAYREALIACSESNWLRRARLHRKYSSVIGHVNNDLADQALRLAENSLLKVGDRTPQYWHEWIEFGLSRLEASSGLIAREWTLSSLTEGTLLHGRGHLPQIWRRWIGAGLTRLGAGYGRLARELSVRLDELTPVIEAHGDLSQRIRHLGFLIKSKNVRDNFHPDAETIRFAREYLALQNSTGDLAARAAGLQMLGFVLQLAGQLQEADQCLHDAWELCKQTNDHEALLVTVCYLSLTHRRQGRVEDVCTDMGSLSDALDKSTSVPFEGMVYANRAWLAYREQNSTDAGILAQKALDIWSGDALHFPVQWPAWTVLLALSTDDGNAARAQICLSALLAPDKIGIDLDTDQRLHAALDACSQQPDSTLVSCQGAVAALKEAHYL